MNKLLSANFARLKKDKTFWIGMMFMFGFGIFLVINQYREHIKFDTEMVLDNSFFYYSIIIGILCAVFCSLFLGTEYSDGTIRNKLVVGHTRETIYLSNLIVTTVASLLMCLSFIIAVSALGIPIIGFLRTDIKVLLMMILASILMVLAFSSIFTLISMLGQSKAIVAVISIIGVFILLFAAVYIMTRLDAEEFYNGYVFTDSLGTSYADQIPNPKFLEGTERTIYQFVLDFLPTGQGLQITSTTAVHLWQMPLYSLIITTITTTVGVLFFRKKDIK